MLRLKSQDVVLQRLMASSCRSGRHTFQILRYSSLQPPSSTSEKQASSPNVLHSGELATRKPKVVLHPAPVKPPSSTATATPPPPTHEPVKVSTADQEKVGASQSDSSWPYLDDRAVGIKETVQRDIQHAEDLGILKPTSPDAGSLQRIMHKTFEMMKFYFRGAKTIWQRSGEIRAIRARVKAGGSPLQRWESRLMHQQRQDINKVIPFIIVALVLEEVIPLMALYAPFLLPSTCILPAQQLRIRAKRTHKAIAAAATEKSVFAELRKSTSPAFSTVSLGLCSLLRLPTYGFDQLRMRRVRRHLKFVGVDDQLLLNDSVHQTLSAEELDMALEERGFIIQGLTTSDKKAQLEWWLHSTQKTSPENDAVLNRLALILERH